MKILCLILGLLLLAGCSYYVYASRGRTNKDGCHRDRITNITHCHKKAKPLQTATKNQPKKIAGEVKAVKKPVKKKETKISRSQVAKELGVSTGVLHSITYGLNIPWVADEYYQYWITGDQYEKIKPDLLKKVEKYKENRRKSAGTRKRLSKSPYYYLDKNKAGRAKLPDWVKEWIKDNPEKYNKWKGGKK